MKKKIKAFLASILTIILTLTIPIKPIVFGAEDVNNSIIDISDYRIENNFNESIILKAYNWSLQNIINKLSDIKSAGYNVIEVSQIQGTKNNEKDSSNWFTMFEPTNQKIGNDQIGTEEQLKELCTKAHQYGLKVIVEVELNQVAYNESKDGISELVDEDMKDLDLYHGLGKCSKWNDRYSITQKNIDGMDLNTQNPIVQDMAVEFLNNCIELGVDGFNFDKASSIETEIGDDLNKAWASDYWSYVLSNINNRDNLLIYGNISNNGANNKSAYESFMNISDEKEADLLRTAVFSSDFNSVLNYNDENRGVVSTFDNAYSYYLGDSNNLSDAQRKLCYAFISARDNSVPVMFLRPGEAIGDANEDLFKDKDIIALNDFHNKMKNCSDSISLVNDSTVIIQRGNKGAVIVNSGDETTINVRTTLEDGIYENKASSGGYFIVSNGILTGNIKKNDIAIFYQEKTIFFQKPASWDKVSVYVYDISGNEVAKWPGEQMTLDEDGIYSYKLPDGWENEECYCIFTNCGDVIGSTGNQIPETNEMGFLCNKNSMIYWLGNEEMVPYYKTGFIVGSLIVNKKSPSQLGNTIQIIAGAGGVDGEIKYQFYIIKDGTKIELNEYSTSNIIDWTPTETGNYIIGVNAIDTSGEIVNKEMNYIINDKIKINSINFDKKSPCIINNKVNISTDLSNEIGNEEYEYYYILNGAEKIIRKYSVDKDVNWIPSNIGEYIVGVRVKDSLGNIISKTVNYNVINDINVEKFDINTDKYLKKNSDLTCNIVANGGYGDLSYKFEIISNDKIIKTIKDSKDISWTPSEVGTYTLRVTIKDQANNVKTIEKNIYVYDSLIIDNLSFSNTFGIIGKTTELSMNINGGAGELKYQYTVIKDGKKEVIQSYSAQNKIKWIPKEAGKYTVIGEVRDQLNNSDYKIIDDFEVKDWEYEDVKINNFSSSIKSPQKINTIINLTGEATGNGELSYKFEYELNGEMVTIQDYSTINTCSWVPYKDGDYTLVLTVKDKYGNETSSSIDYQINKNNITTIYYKGYSNPYIHYKVGDGSWTTVPGVSMISTNDIDMYEYKATIDLDESKILTACFNDGKGCWDNNNNNKNYTFESGIFGVYNNIIKPLNIELSIDSINMDKQSPITKGTNVMLSTKAKNIVGKITYIYTVEQNENSKVIYVGDSDSIDWTPSSSGQYIIKVFAIDDSGSTASKSIVYDVMDELSIINFSVDNSEIKQGGTVKLSATTNGGIGEIKYKFYLEDGTIISEGNNNNCSWKPENSGEYSIYLKVTDELGNSKQDMLTINVLKKNNEIIVKEIKTDIESPSVIGRAIKLSANATCEEKLKYRFVVQKSGKSVYTRDYKESNYATWTPTEAGTYIIHYKIKNETGTVAHIKKEFVISEKGTIIVKNYGCDLESPQLVGTKIKLNVDAICDEALTYRFVVQKDGKSVYVRGYKTSNEAIWTPTEAGTYTIHFKVKNESGTVEHKTLKYTIEES